MRMFIKQQLLEDVKQNFAIIVPTKALINEVSHRLIYEELNTLLKDKGYKVVKFADQLTLKKDGNFIFVLTPERLLYLLISNPDIDIDYVFIDEAHKISSNDKRSAFYYKVVNMFDSKNRTKLPHFIFASPNIPNPQVYLKMLPERTGATDSLASSYSPVSQIKFLIDIPALTINFYNPQTQEFPHLKSMHEGADTCAIVHRIGCGKQNIVYVSATEAAVELSREFADKYARPTFTAKQIAKIKEKYKMTPQELLSSLSNDIKPEVHPDCFLVKTILKGVAYHIGYLPSSIRMRIEELFRDGVISTLFCTSTLIEGVNLPAQNLFITSYWNGTSHLTQVEFRNLIGRVGRINNDLFGNVFLIRLPEKEDAKRERNKREEFEKLLKKEVPEQELSIVSELNDKQKKRIVEHLSAGNISLLNSNEDKLPDGYELMRKFAQILLKDILHDRNTFVLRAFDDFIDSTTVEKIKKAFKDSKDKIDDDINTSVDQVEDLRTAVADGIAYPTLDADGGVDHAVLLTFLKRLLSIFKWERYEKKTLGQVCKGFRENKACRLAKKCPFCTKPGDPHKLLGWYAVILNQWLQSKGVSQIIDSSMRDKKTKNGLVGYGDKTVPYNDSDPAHRNMVISETLKAIEQVVLFSLANYFLKFSNEYKRFHGVTNFSNDWYEFVEYGTCNELVIYLQRSGFSREVALYVKNNATTYLVDLDTPTPHVKRSIVDCSNANVKKEVAELLFNAPDLFVL